MSDIATQIRAHRPAGAKAYFLTDFEHRYPASGGFALEPLTQPFGLPPGEYRIWYLSDPQNGQPIAAANPALPHPTIKVSAEASVALAPGKPQSPEKPAAKVQHIDPLDTDPDHLRHRVEFEAIRMADETVMNKQLLPRPGLRTREIGEGFVLNRAWRQETEQLVRMLGATHRQTLEQSKQTLLQAKETAQLLIEAGKAQPAPPPDHMTPFLGLMGQVVGMIGGALSGRGRKAGKGEEILEALVGNADDGEGDDPESPTRQALRRMQQELESVKKRLAKKQKAAAKEASAPKARKASDGKRKKKSAEVKKKEKDRKKSQTGQKVKTKRTAPSPGSKAPKKQGGTAGRTNPNKPKPPKQLPAKGAK